MACQSPLSPGILQARILEWVAMCSPRDNLGGPLSISWQAREAELRLPGKETSPVATSARAQEFQPALPGGLPRNDRICHNCLNQSLATCVSHWFCFSGWYAWKIHPYSEISQTGIGLPSELVAQGPCSFPLRYPNQRQERRTLGGFVCFVYGVFFYLFKWIAFKLLKYYTIL